MEIRFFLRFVPFLNFTFIIIHHVFGFVNSFSVPILNFIDLNKSATKQAALFVHNLQLSFVVIDYVSNVYL